MENSNKNKPTARQILSELIEKKKLRKTPERFAILDEIYQIDGHFTIDSLYSLLNEKNYHVSRATLYNTVELLLECNLVLKHHFGKETAEYEKCYNCKVHHHLVCTNCGEIREFTDVNIRRNIQTKHYKKFDMTHYSLVVYGLCEKCKEAQSQTHIKTKGES